MNILQACGRLDAPRGLRAQASMTEKANAEVD